MKVLAACPQCSRQYDLTGWQAGDVFRCRCGGIVTVPTARASDANLVRCASCGATRNDSKASHCEYCGALFSAVAKGWGSMCPKCFCRLPADAGFCVECGTKIDPHTLTSSDTEYKCPRCPDSHLAERLFDRIIAYECAACAGLWLRSGVFEELCRSRDTQAMATQGLGLLHAHAKIEATRIDDVKYIPCPGCKNLMNRHNFAHISGVVIDTCKCGAWFDNQELNRIITFIQDGGLERSHKVEEMQHNSKMRGHYKPPAHLPNMRPASHTSASTSDGAMWMRLLVDLAGLFFK